MYTTGIEKKELKSQGSAHFIDQYKVVLPIICGPDRETYAVILFVKLGILIFSPRKTVGKMSLFKFLMLNVVRKFNAIHDASVAVHKGINGDRKIFSVWNIS